MRLRTREVAGVVFALSLSIAPLSARAEDGSAAWLRYAPIANPKMYKNLPSHIEILGASPTDQAAAAELKRGLTSMLGHTFDVVRESSGGSESVANSEEIILCAVSTLPELPRHVSASSAAGLFGQKEAFEIDMQKEGGHRLLLIIGATPQAELYGVFHLLEEIAAQKPIPAHEEQAPSAPIRWTNEWDNLNGSIEHQHSGPSIFFEGGHVRQDLQRAGQYARLLSSVGINGVNVNNVNADLDVLSTEHLREFARIAEVFRPWGVKLAMSVDLTSPQVVGKLDTFDPLDAKVIAWWKAKVDEIYTLIPDFGGFTVKADSEGRKGPSQYGRSPADAANVLARALAPHGGIVMYRGFVYNNHLDWNDMKADRARAGVDNFVKYDGTFEPNVIIQVKEGPIDFQTREPVSPLFAALPHTSIAIEVQTVQEYTGQQRHMVFLPSMWKWVLDTDLRAGGRSTPVKSIVEGKAFPMADGKPRMGGYISVTNVGMEANWLHHPMALANLYGFGKLAWNPDTPVEQIVDTWTRLTWGNDPEVEKTIDAMQLKSWSVYEGYTGPNGMGTLTNITGYHYGPGIESAERNGWGQWFRGDKDGIGMDRTAAGTGMIQQYPPELAAKYESLATCPDDLVLFFHHVPYDYKLHSGKTLIQSIYDTHYASALAAAEYVPQWMSLKGKVDDDRYEQVLALFNYQAGHALVWRDAIDSWFAKISGIPDAQGRVGRDPNRIEAESMQAVGYKPIDVVPWEDAGGGKAVECREAGGCTLKATLQKPAGMYDIAVQYFDLWKGESTFDLRVNGKSVATWKAADTLPPAAPSGKPDGNDTTRYTAHHVALKPGDVLELRGVPDMRPELAPPPAIPPVAGAPVRKFGPPDLREYAPVDYIELGPDGPITPQ